MYFVGGWTVLEHGKKHIWDRMWVKIIKFFSATNRSMDMAPPLRRRETFSVSQFLHVFFRSLEKLQLQNT